MAFKERARGTVRKAGSALEYVAMPEEPSTADEVHCVSVVPSGGMLFGEPIEVDLNQPATGNRNQPATHNQMGLSVPLHNQMGSSNWGGMEMAWKPR